MTWTWLGAAVLAFLVLTCFVGYRRGFVKEVVSALFLLLSIGIAWAVNPYVNEFIRENTPVYETVQEGCQNFVEAESEGGTSQEEENSLIEGLALPDLFKDNIEDNNTQGVYEYLAVSTLGEYISEYLAQSVVNGISFLISFLLATLLVRMVSYALNVLSRLPVINGVNKAAGALIGIIKGVIFIWLAFLILTILCNTQAGKIGLEMIERDPFLSFLYGTDIFIRIFMSIF